MERKSKEKNTKSGAVNIVEYNYLYELINAKKI
ncbi:hypothetical protein SALLE_v1c02890 [Spiroplasma alleghenense]|uniref:Uncharacterized protein n=2 Tax=Spiroplasma alleghenense TaxID=216931 RepID=A0A345Z2Y4_9MOLU|nr:hypothetical protein SALLE_v1c02890 [Spiroplasma alleghenense]